MSVAFRDTKLQLSGSCPFLYSPAPDELVSLACCLFCLCSDDRYGEDSEFCQPKYILSGELVLQRFAFSFWFYRGRRVARPTPCSLTKRSSTLLGIPTSSRSC